MSYDSTIRERDRLRQHSIETSDGVHLSVMEAGNPAGRPIVFVHGISQCWRSWANQFENSELRLAHRLVAMDLRGHGQSQGALGALDIFGKPYSSLSDEVFNGGDPQSASARWACDVSAVIDALGLTDFLLVGWSYGGVVAQDYLVASGGLGKANKVLLLSTVPGLQPPGTPEIGADVVFWPAAIDSLLRTTPINPLVTPPSFNDGRQIIGGLTDFLTASAEDRRPRIADDDLLEALAFNLLTPAAVRLAILGRAVDNRHFFRALSERDRGRVLAITGDADGIFRAESLHKLWHECGIESQLSPGDGHLLMARNADYFNSVLLNLAV